MILFKESHVKFGKDLLKIDVQGETERIVESLQYNVRQVFRRYGAVVGISGGIDSSVVLALCARAFGPDHVVAVMMPEKESDPESEMLARKLAAKYGIEPVLENITPILEGFQCYPRRDEAIRRVFPEYDPNVGYTSKIGLPQDLYEETAYNIFYLTIVTPTGEEKTMRLPPREYLQIVAASNFKQRTRMSLLYYHAELHNFAVMGTGNKNEHEQGFFVKYGDGGADIKPIAHLFKTQVYQLAEFLEVPDEIRMRTPTTDTYSARSTQQEFFFRLPFDLMDLLWYAQEHNYPVPEVASVTGLSEIQVQRAYDDFVRKQRTTEYLRLAPVDLIGPISSN
jgi:NAD+ synthase